MSDIETKLKNPFPANAVHWRVGSTTKDKSKGTALAYLNARDVMKRLDEVIGMENWKDCYAETASGRLICTLKVRIDGEWIGKTDGAGDTNVEGEKGAISDAFKRAAVKWGIGRYLYYLPAKWVEIDQYRKIKNPPQLPKWALPKDISGEKSANLEGWQ
jgi:hypothetical protein